MSLLIAASALLIAGQAPVAVPPVAVGIKDGVPLVGGPYAGFSVGIVTTPEGKSFRGLMPSRPGASPASAKDEAAIAAFVAGHANPSAEPLATYLKKNVSFIICRQQGAPCQKSGAIPLTFAEAVKANTPYSMGGGKVRIEWIFGTAVYYITELTLKGGKIASARTQPGWPPLEIGKAR